MSTLRYCILRNKKQATSGTLLQALGGIDADTSALLDSSPPIKGDDSEDPFRITGGLPSKIKRDLLKAQKKMDKILMREIAREVKYFFLLIYIRNLRFFFFFFFFK